MKPPLMLAVMVLIAGCATVASRPCPRVTEFPPEVQRLAADELANAPTLRSMMDRMAEDRAYNRAICPQ